MARRKLPALPKDPPWSLSVSLHGGAMSSSAHVVLFVRRSDGKSRRIELYDRYSCRKPVDVADGLRMIDGILLAAARQFEVELNRK